MKAQRNWLAVCTMFIMAVVCGCTVSKATLDLYVDPNYDGSEVQKVAVFPLKNARLAMSEAKQIDRKLSQGIHNMNPDVEIMSSAEAVSALNDRDLADDWAIFLDNYVTSGIPDANVLREIGQTLGVDAIIQGEVVNVFQQDGRYGSNKGNTRVTIRFSMLSTRKGVVLWEASSDGVKATATTLEESPPIIEAINLAVDKIVANLPF